MVNAGADRAERFEYCFGIARVVVQPHDVAFKAVQQASDLPVVPSVNTAKGCLTIERVDRRQVSQTGSAHSGDRRRSEAGKWIRRGRRVLAGIKPTDVAAYIEPRPRGDRRVRVDRRPQIGRHGGAADHCGKSNSCKQ